MKILITCSTKFEISDIATFFNIKLKDNTNFYTTIFFKHVISILITGIGSFQTIYRLTKNLNEFSYDFCLNVGICGSYQDDIPVGTVVNVLEEQFGDFGIDDNGNFKNLFKTNLINKAEPPFINGKLINNTSQNPIHLQNIRTVKSLTLNTASGEEKKINFLKREFNADIENMEGAGFFYVCLLEKISFFEIRAISNLIEPRNKEHWKIQLSIKNLTAVVKILLLELIK